jgi:hypothetical protein
MTKHLILAGILAALVSAAPVAYVAAPVVYQTWTATRATLDARKKERAQRDYEKKLKYIRAQHSDPMDFLKPAKVHPNVRDLPD